MEDVHVDLLEETLLWKNWLGGNGCGEEDDWTTESGWLDKEEEEGDSND
jgi:hypothetical protein